MCMKTLDIKGNTYLHTLSEGNNEWYYALEGDGDLYEAQDIFRYDGSFAGNGLYLVHYPEGTVYTLHEKKKNTACGQPVGHKGKASFVTVDFEEGIIEIHTFDCQSHACFLVDSLPLNSVKDCYNLRLHEYPLTLSRQDNSDTFEVIWPERKDIPSAPNESFFYREDNKLYFSVWHEDPDYREEVIIRDLQSGEIMERYPGDIMILPDGQLWYLSGKGK